MWLRRSQLKEDLKEECCTIMGRGSGKPRQGIPNQGTEVRLALESEGGSSDDLERGGQGSITRLVGHS